MKYFLIDLQVSLESGAMIKRERIVPAPDKDTAYDKFLADDTILKIIRRSDGFKISLREVEGI
jgi:hypothetical protein